MKCRSRLSRFRRAALLFALLLAAASRVQSASVEESRAFEGAQKSFAGLWWNQAENEFADFIQKFPESERRAEAVLRQAQARYHLTNSVGAVALLATNLSTAGKLAEEYQFWLGESRFQGSNYLAATEAYGRVVHDFPNSPLVAQAAYNQALAYARLGDWVRVAALLGASDSVLQRAIQSNSDSTLVVDALLLLSEAQLAQRQYRAAEQALQPLSARNLSPRSNWHRQYLISRALVGEGRLPEALQSVVTMERLATNSPQRALSTETSEFKAALLQQLGRTDEAVAEYEKNLAAEAPAERRRLAVLRVIQMRIEEGKLDDAALRLEKYVGQFPQDASSAALLLALGEVNLRRYLATSTTNLPVSAATNSLQAAMTLFNAVITNGVGDPLYGRAQLDRGWALWSSGRIAESVPAFEAATRALPPSEDQAIARFKWADAQFDQSDFKGALTNYTLLVDGPAATSPLRGRLLEPALYQLVRAAMGAGDQAAADKAMARILEWYPDGDAAQSGLLLRGQELTRSGLPAMARVLFDEFAKRFANSPLLPQVRLARARTFEREAKWLAALEAYKAWALDFPEDARRPQVDYARGWATYQAGLETNALVLFTNLVATRPTNEVAALAQNWIADYYFRNGEFKPAEENYQLLFQKWPATEFAYPARLMAARAAVARVGFSDAVSYLTNMINDPKCPTNLVVQALFELGDATSRMESTDTNRPLANYEEAIRAFSNLRTFYPSNVLSVVALGRIGDCWLQLAAQRPDWLTNATSAYQKLLEDPRAGVAARSQAEVGLGLALDKQARRKPDAEQKELQQLVLQHYLNVAYEKNLRAGEQADPFWLKKAALEAARLAEELQLWEQAAKLYETLTNALPPLKAALEPRIFKAHQQADAVRQ